MKVKDLNMAQKWRVKQWMIIERAHARGRLATAEEICCADDLISDDELAGMDFDAADFGASDLYEPGSGKRGL